MNRLLIITLASICLSVHAQNIPLPATSHKAVYGSGFYINPSHNDYSAFTRSITANATTDRQRAKAIYLWICANITYDTTSDIRTADLAWAHRRAVCQGYCELYYRMATSIGLNVSLIYGKTRTPVSPTIFIDHSWLSVSTDQGPLLIDPTWGAGTIVGTRFITNPSPLTWFDADPHWFIFTHMPNAKRHQHLRPYISENQFTSLPFATPLHAHLQLTSDEALRKSLIKPEPYPLLSTITSHILSQLTFHKVPQTHHLSIGNSYTFIIENPDPDLHLSLSIGNDIIPDNRWSPSLSATTRTITIAPTHATRIDLLVTSPSTHYLSLPLISYEASE